MGHIKLDAPVTNILLFKVLSTNLSKLLEIPTKDLEDIIYFRSYSVSDNGLTNLLKKKEVIEKKSMNPTLIGDILQEIIADKKNLRKIAKERGEKEEEIIKKAQELLDNLQEKVTSKDTDDEQV